MLNCKLVALLMHFVRLNVQLDKDSLSVTVIAGL